MATIRELIDIYECLHCGRRFRTSHQLRSHTNRVKRCYERENARKNEQQKKAKLDDIGKNDHAASNCESLNMEKDDEDEEITDIPSQENPTFDGALELMKFFSECAGGVGLSNNDISKALKILKHPQFNVDEIPYHNGPSGKLWLKKKLESINGPLQV